MIDDYDRYDLNWKKRVGFVGMLLFVVAVAGWLFYQNFWLLVLVPLFYRKVENIFCRHLVNRRKIRLISQFQDLLYSLSASFAVGRQMREALIEGRKRLKEIYSDEELICIELSGMVRQLEESGETVERLFREFAHRTKIREIQNFSDVCEVCKDSGGNLEEAAGKAIRILLTQIDMKKEIDAMTAQKRYEIRILLVIPCLLIAVLQLTSPYYLFILYASVAGRILMSVSLVLILSAQRWCEHLISFEGQGCGP